MLRLTGIFIAFISGYLLILTITIINSSSLDKIFILLSFVTILFLTIFCNYPVKVLGLVFFISILLFSYIFFLPIKNWQNTKEMKAICHFQVEQVNKYKHYQSIQAEIINCHPFKKHKKLLLNSNLKINLQVGEIWQAQIKLKGISHPINFADRNKEMALLAKGYVAKGSLVNNKFLQLITPAKNNFLVTLKTKFNNFFATEIKNDKVRAILKAMLMGDRGDLLQEDWFLFQKTGTAHLIAISGLHIGIIFTCSFLLLNFIRQYIFPAQDNKIPVYILAFIITFLYALVTDMALPTFRAILMLFAAIICRMFKISINFIDILLFAICIILIVDPFVALTASFYLSVFAVLVIIITTQNRLDCGNKLISTINIQKNISLALIPITTISFSQISLIGFIVNFPAIFITTFLVMPFGFITILAVYMSNYMASFTSKFAEFGVELIYKLITYSASFAHASKEYNANSLVNYFALIFLVLFSLLPKKFPGKSVSVLILLPLFIPLSNQVGKNKYRLTILDVGQGLSILLESSGRNLLFDTGPGWEESSTIAKQAIIPELKSRNIKKIDILIISHQDNDHIGGFYDIYKEFKIKKIISNEKIKNYPSQLCRAGDNWQWQDIKFTFLSPNEKTKGSRNNRSCVLKISINEFNILLPGDIERTAELNLLTKANTNLKANILVAPHHGSKTSSSSPFLVAVNPEIVIYSSGYLNKYHLPHKIIETRYEDLGVKSYNTAFSGAIEFTFNNQGLLKVRTAREERRGVLRKF